MKTHPFFPFAVFLGLFILTCLSGCTYREEIPTDTIHVTATGNQVPVTPGPVQTHEQDYSQEQISPVLRAEILRSAPSIRYFSMNDEEKRVCIRSDSQTLINSMLTDLNAQDMLMKGGQITGIGPYLPRSASTMPGTTSCTAAVYITGRNITSAFVIDQEKEKVTQQVVEVRDETHVRSSMNRTIISDADEKIIFIFNTGQYSRAD